MFADPPDTRWRRPLTPQTYPNPGQYKTIHILEKSNAQRSTDEDLNRINMVSIRPAIEADLPQIRSINTHYIQHTCLTFAQTTPAPEKYTEKLHDLIARGLPYLVAVEPDHETGNDDVLGYASLAPFREHLVSYAPTVELSLFVHPDHRSRSIGSRLLSTLLDRVRAGDVVHRISGRTDEAGVPVQNVIAVMAVDPEGLENGEALRRFYFHRGFQECGRLRKVGFKRGHW